MHKRKIMTTYTPEQIVATLATMTIYEDETCDAEEALNRLILIAREIEVGN